MPDVRVVKIGGQSVMDRGREALFPILDELVAARKAGIPMLLLAGGGTRARHIYAIASELELPTGVLAALGAYVPMQNARMLQMLLAKHGGVYIMPDDFEKLPLYIQMGCMPIMTGMPPFGYWEKRDKERPHPAQPHRRRRVPVGRVPRRAPGHLHQGRRRPLHRRSQEEPRAPSTSRRSARPS
jgi:molybdenum storage protein